MFTGRIVDTIVRTANVFGNCVGRELKGLSYENREQLATAFDRALSQTAISLNTKTADAAIAQIKPRVREWLGL